MGTRSAAEGQCAMAKSTRAPTLAPAEVLDWTGGRTQRVEYEPAAVIRSGESGHERHVCRDGRRAAIGLVARGKRGRGRRTRCRSFLRRRLSRRPNATDGYGAMAASTILAVEKPDMVRQLHAQPAFADRFLTHMLVRNIRIEEDLIDQLFNSTEKRLARTLLLLGRYGTTSILRFRRL
jgi:hypothetical protein